MRRTFPITLLSLLLLSAIWLPAGAAAERPLAEGPARSADAAPDAGGNKNRKPGMDVSAWQEDIDWGQVGNGQITFSITRASHGWEADEYYEDNRAGAEAEGIAFGAYHYAVPKGTPKAAVEQAAFFLDNATPQAGDILPVLDMEATSGKSPERLIKWTAAFLRKVERETGVKAMIYTSPSFWESEMGNTRRFARQGHPLWIAHWETQDPDVPANNWAGNGWTFWQWTDCRSVNGIEGCVDGDRYRGTNLNRAEIPD